MVVWLAPSDAIIEQTVNTLSNVNHPYRQKIDQDFAGKVGVYTKEQLKNDDSKAKLALGKKWDMMGGSKCKYYMVFEHKEMEIQGSYMMDKFIEILKNL